MPPFVPEIPDDLRYAIQQGAISVDARRVYWFDVNGTIQYAYDCHEAFGDCEPFAIDLL